MYLLSTLHCVFTSLPVSTLEEVFFEVAKDYAKDEQIPENNSSKYIN